MFAIVLSLRRFSLLALIGQPVDEAGQNVGRDLDQLQPFREVGMSVCLNQTAVFLARMDPKASSAFDPLVEELDEPDRSVLLTSTPRSRSVSPSRFSRRAASWVGAMRFRCLPATTITAT